MAEKPSTGGKLRRIMHKGTGTDISENQIEQAIILSKGMDIDYHSLPTEDLDFPDESFDVITACQCFWYFNHEEIMPKFFRMLKPDGRILVLYMAWLPFEDEIAGASEKLVLKYNPAWSGASLVEEEVRLWEQEHMELLAKIAPSEFDVLHYGAIAELKARK